MLSITNLSWFNEDEEIVLNNFIKNNFNKIELSLTKKFCSWEDINEKKLKEYKNYLFDFGITIGSLQSLFYGKTYNLFTDNILFKDHFKKILDYSNILESKYLVFGSPKNRVKNNIPDIKAQEIFIETFQELSEYNKDIFIGIETNPKYYNCDFITSYHQCRQLLSLVNRKNVLFHLDTGCVSLNGDSYEEIYKLEQKDIKLLHLSIKDLKFICDDLYLFEFVKKNYNENIIFSIEMLNQNLEKIIFCLEKFKDLKK